MAAVDRAVAEGADIVDIGGVKAGPGASVDAADEARRVVPFVAAVRDRRPDVVISIDTWRAEVADLACAEGADFLIDTWAGADSMLVDVAANGGVGLVCSRTGCGAPYPAASGAVLRRGRRGTGEPTARAERVVALGVPREGGVDRPDTRLREEHVARFAVGAAA